MSIVECAKGSGNHKSKLQPSTRHHFLSPSMPTILHSNYSGTLRFSHLNVISKGHYGPIDCWVALGMLQPPFIENHRLGVVFLVTGNGELVMFVKIYEDKAICCIFLFLTLARILMRRTYGWLMHGKWWNF